MRGQKQTTTQSVTCQVELRSLGAAKPRSPGASRPLRGSGCGVLANLRLGAVDQLPVVELRRGSLAGLGERQVEADCGLELVALGAAPLGGAEQSPSTSGARHRRHHRCYRRRGSSTSIFPKSDVDGLIFAAALLAGLRGRRRVEGRDGDERHFPRLGHWPPRSVSTGGRSKSLARLERLSPQSPQS